jgi:hypothetical protein
LRHSTGIIGNACSALTVRLASDWFQTVLPAAVQTSTIWMK